MTRPHGRDDPANPPGSDRVTTPIVVAPRRRMPGVAARDAQEAARARVQAGWRERVSRVPGIKLGPGKARLYELQLRDRIRASVETVFPVAVFNLKGDVGTTTVVEALGSTFADVRGDRVIAVDLDAGDLADRHGGRSPLGLFDLVTAGTATQYLDVRAHTHMNASGLEVLGAGNDGHRARRVERDDFAKVFEKLRHHYSVVLTDCSKTLRSGVVQAALRRSRAIVVVSSAAIDAITRTRTTLDWLRNNGYQYLLESMVLAINQTEAGKPDAAVGAELEKISRQFPGARFVVLPFDRHLAEDSGLMLERLSKESRRGYLELAATLADLYPAG
ncbi:MinD/ParA family protein [Mycobacterium sp. pUA109]|uniref:MinD/ParA family protein n=1 Tax=Mycobacterium sp. pUA109 TaxID=3238982 RepID=UPI00351BC617